MIKNKSELEFEQEVIEYLTTLGGVKQWKYEPEIRSTEHLWSNFKKIIEQNNRSKLDKALSDVEFNQVKKVINSLSTPYEAGQFLYGVNGFAEVEVDLDNGRHVFLTVFDQAQVGGGTTVYQIVNQISRRRVIDGKQDRRFDITLLINGLPIVQIELKKALHSSTEALNQMEQYIAERQFTDIYSTLQVLVAMTPHDIRYMANTTLDSFNRLFAFNWQTEEGKPVYSWKEFSDKVLSIPMAHNLATRYMILDGTKNKESIKIMRPYQVYATKKALDEVSAHDFSIDDGRLGYIWHTTGSGKTITSFKTAWLASRLSNVDMVIFLVDRIALTNQTADAYKAYDPVAGFEGKTGVVGNTASVRDLKKKITKKSDKNIIVTSIQKMSRFVEREDFKTLDKNILFIVDEAHRSTGDGVGTEGMLESIRTKIPTSAWLGYTGTPKFPETREIFGDIIHAYTIREAIADRNVLGFNVEFKETIPAPDNPTDEDIDDMIKGSVYDNSPKHVGLVVEDMFENWRQRSSNRKYNALLTVHVGGGKASTPRAMEYFDKIVEINESLPKDERIAVAISFSLSTNNSDQQLLANSNLHRAINHYNKTFNTVFDMSNVGSYTEDLARRLNKTSDDGKYLDLLIVVDQFLTGFDAPELNTLYVDRTLKGSNLIQAYSRTNRIHNRDNKPWGNVINYRWPAQNELEMNEALAIYSNRASANEQQSLEELKVINIDSGVISRPFIEVKEDLKVTIKEISRLTEGITREPKSERAQEELYHLLMDYNSLLGQLKQYSVDESNNPVSAYENTDEFYEMLGISKDQEIFMTTVIAEKIKAALAKKDNIDISQVDLQMVHLHDVRINYDYLVDLIARMANEVHDNRMDRAVITRTEIDHEIAKSDSVSEKNKVRRFVTKVYDKEYVFDNYPVSNDVGSMTEAIDKMIHTANIELITNFIRKWGLDNSIKPNELEILIAKHRIGREEMDKQGEINYIINNAKEDYRFIAEDGIKKLSWLNYRKNIRKSIYELADEVKKNQE